MGRMPFRKAAENWLRATTHSETETHRLHDQKVLSAVLSAVPSGVLAALVAAIVVVGILLALW